MPPDKLLDTASTLDTTKTKETVSPPEFFEGEKEINQQYESFFDEAVILGEFESSEIKAKLQQFLQAPENEELKRRLKTSLKRKKDDKEAFNKVIKCFIVDNMIGPQKKSTTQQETPTVEQNNSSNLGNQLLYKQQTETTAQQTEITAQQEKTIAIEKGENYEEATKRLTLASTEAKTISKKYNIQLTNDELEQERNRPETQKLLSFLPTGWTKEQRNDYLITYALHTRIQQNANVSQAEKHSLQTKINKLHQSLNIPHSHPTINATALAQEKQTSSENLIKTNPDLIDNASHIWKDNIAKRKEIFGEKRIDLNTLKERFGAEETFKEATAIYEEYTKLQANGQQLTNEQQQSIEHYHNSLQLHYETKLQEQFAKSTATYPVVFLMDYFDQQTGTEFTLNQSNDIYINNGALTIKGTLNGGNIVLRYDISAEQPQLEINDFLHKQDSTTFQLGMHNFRGTGYLLPSQADINNNLIATYQKTGEKLMETTSFTDFQKKLQTNFETSTDELFGHKELAQLTMERQIRKDATAQKLIPLIQAIKGKIEYTAQNLSEELKTNTHLQNFIRYGDNFLETASIDEIQRFQWCIEQLTIKAKNPDEHPHYSPLLQRFQSADGTFDIFGLFEGLPGYKEFITNPDEHKQDFSLGIEELYSLLQDDNQPTLAQHNTSHYSKLYNQYTQQLETKEKGNVDKDLEIQLEATFGTTTFYA